MRGIANISSFENLIHRTPSFDMGLFSGSNRDEYGIVAIKNAPVGANTPAQIPTEPNGSEGSVSDSDTIKDTDLTNIMKQITTAISGLQGTDQYDPKLAEYQALLKNIMTSLSNLKNSIDSDSLNAGDALTGSPQLDANNAGGGMGAAGPQDKGIGAPPMI